MNRTFLASCYLLVVVLSQSADAKSLVLGGSGTDLGTFRLLAEAFSKAYPDINISVLPSMGSGGGLKALRHGKLDIALTSRALKPTEKSSKITVVHYASTPLVFAVANTSKQQNVSREQVVEIYSGKLRQWPDGSVLRLILRPSKDSDSKTLAEVFAKHCKSCFTQVYQMRGIPVALTDQESARMIARVPGAIGTSTLALMLSEDTSLKVLKLDGVTPSPQNLSNKTYPMYKDLYLAYTSQHNNKSLQVFIDFIFSKTAQSILQKTGHRVLRPYD